MARRKHRKENLLNKIGIFARNAVVTTGVVWGTLLAAPYVPDAAKKTYEIGKQGLIKTIEWVDAGEEPRPKQPHVTEASDSTTQERFRAFGYKPLIEHNFRGYQLAEMCSLVGKAQRALRWRKQYAAVEERYGIEAGTLTAMSMQESCGNPVLPNSTGDGGFGSIHIQGKTAGELGIKITGSSDSYADYKHGKEIDSLIERCDNDPQCMLKEDDRANVLLNADAAGRRMAEVLCKGETLDRAIRHYRGGSAKAQTEYLESVHQWRDFIQSPDGLRQAAATFAKNNKGKGTFQEWLGRWDEMADNWGLELYRQLPPGC